MTQIKLISNWLFFTAFMVFMMAIIGAVTRLTESGLSMVEWRPLIGSLPPLSEAEWNRVFSLYQETPEYQKQNLGMTLSEFKNIFFWEWFHRLWGRLIGIVYALPLFYFWIKKLIPKGYKFKLLLGLILGSLQAFMGWYMVKSGLIDRPSVSHFRLAAHLGLAFLIFSYLLWIAFSLQNGKIIYSNFYLKCSGWISLFFLGLTITWGAFVAGLDAGLVYNSWPKMGSHWIPLELQSFNHIFYDPVSVQFIHRWIAILTAMFVITFAYRVKNWNLIGMVFIQIGLGIFTLISQVFIPLAAIHQAGAFILVGLTIYQLEKLNKK